MYPTLFASPKRGGILQSSGFLDLKSLMALSQTAKSNALDELSLLLLIEHEICTQHSSQGVRTMEEAICFLREVYQDPQLKPWLERDQGSTESIVVARDMLLEAAMRFDVMLLKMLRSFPESERLQTICKQDPFGNIVLHYVASSKLMKCTKDVLALCPESEWKQAVMTCDNFGKTVLHCAARSGNFDSLETMLALFPESERLDLVRMSDQYGGTMLHYAARSGSIECIQAILSLYPESERLLAVNVQTNLGSTVLHCAAGLGHLESFELILSLYPESERLRALNMTNRYGETVLHCATDSNDIEYFKAILSLYPKSQRRRAVNRPDGEGNTVLDRMDEHDRDLIKEWLTENSEKASYHRSLQTDTDDQNTVHLDPSLQE